MMLHLPRERMLLPREWTLTKLLLNMKILIWIRELGENPWRAPMRDVFPPDRAPSGRAPVGVSPFNCRTC